MAGGSAEAPPSWDQPAAEPIAPGIHRLPMPLPNVGLPAVNTYSLQVGDGGVVMVDAGWSPFGPSGPGLVAALSQLGRRARDIRGFLITHLHRDHYTFAVEHRREYGSWIALGRREQASLRAFARFDSRPHEVDFARLRTAGAAELASTIPVDPVDPRIWEPPDRWIDDGDRFTWAGGEVVAVATPGHTAGHNIFVEEGRGVAFTGDHVLPRITPTVGSEPAPTGRALADYLSSLARMLTLPDLVVLPAHGAAGGSLHRRSAELIQHHADRLTQCEQALDGRSTAAEVAGRLRWTRREVTVDKLPPHDQLRAIFETAVHLDELARRGHARRHDMAGVAYFERIA